MKKSTSGAAALAAAFLALPLAAQAAAINIDINGVRYGDGSKTTDGPTYVGVSPAGGGTVWNGVLADSRTAPGEADIDWLFFGGTNLVDSTGAPTGAWFWMGPTAAGNQGTPEDPTQITALLWDWVLVGYFGEFTGKADWTIGGLGTAPTADLYFYHRGDFPGGYTIGTAQPSAFGGAGPFNSVNTIQFKNVLIADGQIVGDFHEVGLLGLVSGFTVALPEPGPYVKSTAPSGVGVRPDAPIVLEIWDYVTQLKPSSVQVFLNDQPVTAIASEHTGANYWTVTARPAGGFAPGAINTVRFEFGDTSTPAVVKGGEFSFAVVEAASASKAINVDINGWRGSDEAAVTYVGQGAAGGAVVFNGVSADSTLGDDQLSLTATGLLDSIGDPTSVSFTLAPVAGERMSVVSDPANKDNLFADFAAVGFEGETTGAAQFEIAGLAGIPTVDLYFYMREDPLSDGLFAGTSFTIPGGDVYPFAARGIFNSGNTVYMKNVPVVEGKIAGVFSGQVGGWSGEGSAAGAWSGFTLKTPLPKPYVKKATPRGDFVQATAPVVIELQDYYGQVDRNSIELELNGAVVTPVIAKPAGSTVTTVSYSPPGGLIAEAANTMKVTFADLSSPPLVQTEEFSFFVISQLKAANIVNIDINGVGHSTLPLGPTYVGSGAAGGGSVFNGVLARTRLEDGSDDDAITVTGTNLKNSLGGATPISFSIGPVAAGNSGSVGGEFSENWAALNHDWILVGYFGQTSGAADFQVGGLGNTPVANLYFYFREDPRDGGRFGAGAYDIPGVAGPSAYAGRGLFGNQNTTFFENVPVSNGTIAGTFKKVGVFGIMTGLTIELPLPHPFVKSFGPKGGGVAPDAQIQVELSDYDIVKVVSGSVQFFVNGTEVTPTIAKPAGSAVTTVTYSVPGGLPSASTVTVKTVFTDTSSPPYTQSHEFSFQVVDTALAARVVNIDINGTRNGDGGLPEIGPTYVGQGAAGGGTVWNGVLADSRVPDQPDNDSLFFDAANLVDSLGKATTVSFEMGPVAAGNQGTTTDPTALTSLLWDWVLVGYFGEATGTADITIGGLGTAPKADLYFYHRGDFPGTYTFGATAPFAGAGVFTAGNTVYIPNVPVVDGKIVGRFTEGTSLLGLVSGLTVALAPAAAPGPLHVELKPAGPVVSWSGGGTLQSANRIDGGWTDVPGAASPYAVAPSAPQQFFRLKQ